MPRFLRYGVTHCLHTTMARLREVSMRSFVRSLRYLPELILLLALCLGIYARWELNADPTFLAIFVLALLVLGVAGVLYVYFDMERVSRSVLHLWFGYLLGQLCLVNSPAPHNDVKERTVDDLLLSSLGLGTLGALLERLLGCARYRPACLTSGELLELVGFAVACTALRVQESLSVMVLVVSLACVIIALRVKAFLALPNLVSFVAITAAVFFESLQLIANPVALVCFFGRVIWDPLLDNVSSGLSVTERWQPFLLCRGLWRRLSLLPLLAAEVAFIALAGRKLAVRDLWYYTLPGFVVCAIFWCIFHLVFVFTAWGFHTKLSECQRLGLGQRSGVGRLDKIMASRGMRHFCLISERMVALSLVTTVAVTALCWQASSSLFVSVVLLVLPLESLFHGLFYELGNCLGGTCVGYALVIPTNYCSPDGQPMLLPPDQVQDLNRRSTGMLNSVQRFFAHHLIETFGCDYSTSGVTLEALQIKIKSFLELRTADGPRHDTYVIFYSGHTHRSGEWALAGGDTLRLEHIVELWRETNGRFCSRLILVLDCENTLPWVNGVQNVAGPYLAVQGATLAQRTDAELQDTPQLGDFTSQWVEYNCDPNSNIQWSLRGRGVSAIYGISKHWSDFKLHLPTGSDIGSHLSMYYPQMMHPLVQSVIGCDRMNEPSICGSFLQSYRRIKLNWFPPAILDTGQGFKLVRS